MNKSTGAISLVLLGTTLALAGCSSDSDDEEGDWHAAGGQRAHVVAPIIRPGFRSGGFGGGGSVSSGPSARGGFGGIGSVGGGS
jgi:hypothetical protein